MKLLPPPGPERRRQLTLLGFLVVVLTAYYGYRYWPTAGGAAAPSNEKEAGSAAAQNRDKLTVPAPIDLAALEPAPPDSPTSRNPFRFGQPPPLPTPPAPPPPPPQPERPYEPPKPPAPQVPLKLLQLGSVSGTKQPLVTLLDPESGATFSVREGERVDGKYKVVKVNANNVVVAFLDGSGQKSLYLEK
jgi:type IV pilus biogenesis protein PilP